MRHELDHAFLVHFDDWCVIMCFMLCDLCAWWIAHREKNVLKKLFLRFLSV